MGKSAAEVERAKAMAYVWNWFHGKANQEFMAAQLVKANGDQK